MSLSNDFENKLLDHWLGGGDFTRDATVYIGLARTTITDSDTGTGAVPPEH